MSAVAGSEFVSLGEAKVAEGVPNEDASQIFFDPPGKKEPTRGTDKATWPNDGWTLYICRRLADGEAMMNILGSIEAKELGIPSQSIVRTWLWVGEEPEEALDNGYGPDYIEQCRSFARRHARARLEQADTRFFAIGQIADSLDREGLTNNDVNAARVRIDAHKIIAERLRPKRYGQQVGVRVAGKVEHAHVVMLPDNGRGDRMAEEGEREAMKEVNQLKEKQP